MSSRGFQHEPVVISNQSPNPYPETLYRNVSPSSSLHASTTERTINERRVNQSSNILYSILSRQMDQQLPTLTSKYSTGAADERADMDVEISERGISKVVERQSPALVSSSYKQRLIHNRAKEIENSAQWRKREEMNRTSSRESFGSCDGGGPTGTSSDESATSGGSSVDGRSAEDLVEQARNKMTRLSTDGLTTTICSSKSESSISNPRNSLLAISGSSLSNPGTPRTSICVEALAQHRKYSMGNRGEAIRCSTASPVDLSCKRKRVESCSMDTPTIIVGDLSDLTPAGMAKLRGRSSTFSTSSSSAQVSGGRSTSADVSLLEAALRGRSSTFSIGMHPSLSNYNAYFRRNGSKEHSANHHRQQVTLAKRNLNPVKSRVLERLTAMTSFVLDLPEFCALPFVDQHSLLLSATHRLLLLFMAESNLEFAVTTVQADDAPDMDEGVETSSEVNAFKRTQRRQAELPTMQFVESVQNFIGKCQAINVRPSEYFFMRWIILFHPGLNRLKCRDVVTNLNTAARQDLQEIIAHSHPSDKLRYSKLLLALHTVYGINCGMVDELFCAPLSLRGGTKGFVSDLLYARNGPDGVERITERGHEL